MSDLIELQKHKDASIELEKAYSVPLTEKEIYLIARNISRMFRKKHNGKHEQSQEETFHLMLICDKFKKAMDSSDFKLIKKERLPV